MHYVGVDSLLCHLNEHYEIILIVLRLVLVSSRK